MAHVCGGSPLFERSDEIPADDGTTLLDMAYLFLQALPAAEPPLLGEVNALPGPYGPSLVLSGLMLNQPSRDRTYRISHASFEEVCCCMRLTLNGKRYEHYAAFASTRYHGYREVGTVNMVIMPRLKDIAV